MKLTNKEDKERKEKIDKIKCRYKKLKETLQEEE